MSKNGFDTIYLQPNAEGIIEVAQLQEVIDESVGLVSIMMVNNEIGTVQPIAELANVAHEYGSLFHTDAAQAPVFIKMDLATICTDMVSFSSHKIYGPKGIGAAFVRRQIKGKITPLILGGGQEDGLRSGTLPTPLCVGFAEAFYLVDLNLTENIEKLKKLSALFWNKLRRKIKGIEINGSIDVRHPGNLNIRFPGIKAQAFLQIMQPHLAASTGSACNSGIETPSYVLNEIGLSADAAAESIRFSFGKDQTSEDIIRAVNLIFEAHKKTISTI